MGRYQGSLRLAHSPDVAVGVELDLIEDRLIVRSGKTMIGMWRVGDLGIRGQDDGFHMRAGGDEMIIDLSDDVGFALEVGLQSASPRLRRRMGAAYKERQQQ